MQCRKWGMIPVAVGSGKKALTMLAEGLKPRVILLDMQMPEMDGLEVGKRIRAAYPDMDVAIVIISSHGSMPEKGNYDSIFNAYLAKPTKQSMLFNVLVKIIDKGSSHKLQDAETTASGVLDSLLAKRLPLRILLAEDNAINQKVAIRTFQKMGYSADIAGNGLEALDALARQPYDLVFMDVHMPEMDGLEATREIVREMGENRPKIIAMTANAMQGDQERCLQAGMDDYISKPININELQNIIEKWGNAVNSQRATSEELLDMAAINEFCESYGEDFFVETIQLFLDDARRLVEQIKNFSKDDDFQNLVLSAHELKGTCLAVGAKSLSELCKQIEICGKSKDWPKFSILREELEGLYNRSAERLKALDILQGKLDG